MHEDVGMVAKRRAAKVIIVDERRRVLLLSGIDRTKPSVPPWWFAVGGGLELGESPAEAAVREIYEETGLRLENPGPIVFTRRFEWIFEGTEIDQEEWYFFVQTRYFELSPAALTETESGTFRGHRWWSLEDLRSTKEAVYPDNLVEVIERQLR